LVWGRRSTYRDFHAGIPADSRYASSLGTSVSLRGYAAVSPEVDEERLDQELKNAVKSQMNFINMPSIGHSLLMSNIVSLHDSALIQ
jgi:hypothetical protein